MYLFSTRKVWRCGLAPDTKHLSRLQQCTFAVTPIFLKAIVIMVHLDRCRRRGWFKKESQFKILIFHHLKTCLNSLVKKESRVFVKKSFLNIILFVSVIKWSTTMTVLSNFTEIKKRLKFLSILQFFQCNQLAVSMSCNQKTCILKSNLGTGESCIFFSRKEETLRLWC